MKLPIANHRELPIADWRLPIVSNARRLRRFPIGNWQLAIGNGAFTLIEIMIVVAIIGLMAAMGGPALNKALQKEGMRKAVSDIEDVFFSAREQAIVGNKKVSVVFYPRENRFAVDGAGGGAGGGGSLINVHSGKTLAATLPANVQFAMLEIFRQNYVQSDWARIFFNADGTSDEAVIVLFSGGDTRKITLEYATGLPVVSAVDQ